MNVEAGTVDVAKLPEAAKESYRQCLEGSVRGAHRGEPGEHPCHRLGGRWLQERLRRSMKFDDAGPFSIRFLFIRGG